MNICKYAAYRLKEGLGYSKRITTFDQLTQKYSIQQIKEFMKTKAIAVNYCGKCEFCLSIKKQQYKKRVQSQLKKSKYNYLITLTFDNDNIDLLIPDSQREALLDKNISLSPISNLNKVVIRNIIKNWKNKFNRYYKEKVDFNYFLCGEYGENTKRAHYHILLMMDKPIPLLVKAPVKGNHFKSSIIDSKQYALYDIEPANLSNSTASYISKYLSKAQDYDKGNYNIFHTEQIKELLKDGVNPYGLVIPNKQEDVKYILLWFLLDHNQLELYSKVFNWNHIKCKEIKQQRPFIKASRGLGMFNDEYENFQNGVINRYYFNKYKDRQEMLQHKNEDTTKLDYVLSLYDQKKRQNIQNYFFKSTRLGKNKKSNNDIF